MAYVNNGDYRCKVLTVDKMLDGVSIPGYPKNYNITTSFPGFSSLTDEEFQRLSDVDYQTRLSAFFSYVDNTEDDIDSANYSYAEGQEPFGTNATLCPIGE